MRHFHRPASHIDALSLLRNLAGILGILALALAAMSCLSGCSGTRRVAVVSARHPGAFAQACADRFPVRDSITTRTEYRPGETVYLPGDTVTVNCDTVREYLAGGTVTRTVRIPCPPQLLRVDTFNQVVLHQVENTARVSALQQDLATAAAQARQARGWRTAFIIALIAGLLLLYLSLRSLFTKPLRS